VLFTHETDYIFRVRPENWDAIFRQISRGIAPYNPVYLTTDDALKILRAHHTSAITQSNFDTATGKLEISLSGHADVPTNVWVYTESNGEVQERRVDIPAFGESIHVEVWPYKP
jgi:hypothetical protein